MRKFFWRSLIPVIAVFIISLAASSPLTAQEGSPEIIDYQPNAIESEIGDVLPFNLLGQGVETLNRNQLTLNVGFNLPAHWKLTDGVTVTLNISTSIHNNYILTDDLVGGWLSISMNGVLLQVVPIDQNGAQTLEIAIPQDALQIVSGNGRHVLNISLKTNFGRDSTQEANVTVQPSSFFTLPHQFAAPALDLRQFPYPIQQNTFLSNDAFLVIPDNPSIGEMQALLIASAGLGRITNRTNLQLVRAGELTDEIRTNYHLILIGKYENFPELAEIPFPVSRSNTTLTAKENSGQNKSIHTPLANTTSMSVAQLADTDGLLQIAASPWNPAKAILYIGGNSDTGAIKAARAIGYGSIRTGTDVTSAVINEVYFETFVEPAYKPSQTLTALGYDLETLNGPKVDFVDYAFYIPTDLQIDPEETATFLFVYNHSALLQYDMSGINVKLNNRPVHSFGIDETSTAITSELIDLPATLFRSGENIIQITTELEPQNRCSDLRGEGSWLNIFPESTIYLPLQIKPVETASIPMLNQFPQPMVLDKQLGTTTFVLPTTDSVAWFTAVQIAYDLGRQTGGDLFNLNAAYADDVAQTLLQDTNLILIGIPSELPFLTDLAPYLPVPVSTETNRFASDRLPISYEIPPDVSLGYLNVLTSPWNENHIVVSILGDSEEGLQNASNTLLFSRRNLDGDLAVIESDQMFVTMTPLPETAENANLTDSAETESVATTTETEDSTTNEAVAGDTAANEPESLSIETPPETNAQPEASAESIESASNQERTIVENNTENTIQRQGMTLPIAVLVICLIVLIGFGVRFFLLRRKA